MKNESRSPIGVGLLQSKKIENLQADIKKQVEDEPSAFFRGLNNSKQPFCRSIGIPLSEIGNINKPENCLDFEGPFQFSVKKKTNEENLIKNDDKKVKNISKKSLESLFYKKKRIAEIKNQN